MKKGIFTLVTFLSYVSARAADIATTDYFLSGDMSQEANPLVSVLGFNWEKLLLSNAVISVFLIFIPLYFYWKGHSKRLSIGHESTLEFASVCIYNTKMEPRKFLSSFLLGWPIWPVPKDFYQSIRLLGFALPWGVAAGSMMAVFTWWATWAWSWEIYNEIRASIAIGPYSLVEVSIGYLTFIIASFYFFKSEAKRANKPLQENSGKSAVPQP